MATNIEWFETDGVTPVASLSFTGLVPGTPSAWRTVRVYNDQAIAGADDAIGRRLRGFSRNTSADDFVSEGHPLVDHRGIGVQILSGSAAGVVPGGVVFLGKGATIALPTIQSGEYVELRVNVTIPQGSLVTDAEVAFGLDPTPATGLGDLGPLATRGIWTGIGDSSSQKLLKAVSITASGTPDEFVLVSDVLAQVGGLPVVVLEHLEELTNLDGSAAALTSGNAYVALFSVSASGLVITKGDQAAAPLGVDDEPALPEGNLRLGIVVRPFDDTIEQSDITVEAVAATFDYLGDVGLDVSFSGGEAAVGTILASPAGAPSITLVDDDTSIVSLLSDASLSLAPPAGHASLALYQFVAAAGAVTSVTDLRPFVEAGAVKMQGTIGGGAGDKAYRTLPGNGRWAVDPLLGLDAVLIDGDPSSLSATSGDWVMELKYRLAGGTTWTTLFTSSGSDDRRPTLNEASTDPEFNRGLPEVCVIPAGATLEVSWASVPTGGTPAAGAMFSFTMRPVN